MAITVRSPLELVGDLVHVNTGKGLGGCVYWQIGWDRSQVTMEFIFLSHETYDSVEFLTDFKYLRSFTTSDSVSYRFKFPYFRFT